MDYTKICKVCQEEFPATNEYFHKAKRGLFGLRQECIICRKKSYQADKKDHQIKNRKYYERNKEQILKDAKQYRKENKNTILERQKLWRENNKSKILNINKEYVKNRRKTDPNFKVLLNMRSRIGNALKRNKKTGHTIDLLGCSINEIKLYLESKFLDGMSWNNYGRTGWHIDHIIPCSSFDLTDLKEQKQCFHYTNLQPLWAEDNLSKSDKVL